MGRLLVGRHCEPGEVIEQITDLLFLKRRDEVQELEERKAARLGKPLERRIFPKGKDSKGLSYEEYRWKRFKNADPQQMYERISEHVFPFLRTLGDGSTYAHYMRDARFTIPTPALLATSV